jgi:long-chain fatty acid transport protein
VVTGPVTSPQKDTEAELAQVVIAPSVSYRLNDGHSVGLSLNLAYQRFYAQGTEPLYGDPGTDSSWGAGLALGWAGKLNDRVTFGLSYYSKIEMGKLDRYSGLLANRGQMDIPERYGVGLSAQITEATTIAFDYLRINYGGVKSLSNSVYAFLDPATPPGSKGGPGFGWKDQDIF